MAPRQVSEFTDALLTGWELDCYDRLPQAQALDFGEVKKALMKRYDFTKDGYLRRLRICKGEDGESADMFIERIKTYLNRC
ncbi:reverse transcriptase [Plakobranchus ocellatus]|uniref:Reverse transcriptase n=1 Tax=Plakobranchus ocellatus TaxID=259542 RepID=A0AAV4CCI2_9GAST|nr:reverse transcriptase [Plakobranchus ocellatus]